MKKGSWVFNGNDQIGIVLNTYMDHSEPSDGLLLDIALYNRKGEFVGRESPTENGPGGFEPACPAKYWSEIKKPDFPLSYYMYMDEAVEFI